jgi:urocanate hydratase
LVKGISQGQFQSQVYASYEAVHAALAALVPAYSATAELKGALSGQFIVADSLLGLAGTLPLASVMAGACFLGMDEDAETVRDMLRHGRCDFVVNSLDEALRILKNELRQKKPVAVCMSGVVPAILQEMSDRGVAPQLLMHTLPVVNYPAMQRLRKNGALLLETAGLQGMTLRPPNADGALTHWTLPHGNASMLARLDVIARDCIPESDRKRRRWLESATRYLPREFPPSRVASLKQPELERFVDCISARLMVREIAGPVNISVDGQQIVLGNEAVA